mmetsp:Transcript_82877/g.238150  ORF Transcript_82877/g.238150 Transcript_82877/m.238150 type:complete len:211 (-) Transcript_82877:2164-2796(-)
MSFRPLRLSKLEEQILSSSRDRAKRRLGRTPALCLCLRRSEFPQASRPAVPCRRLAQLVRVGGQQSKKTVPGRSAVSGSSAFKGAPAACSRRLSGAPARCRCLGRRCPGRCRGSCARSRRRRASACRTSAPNCPCRVRTGRPPELLWAARRRRVGLEAGIRSRKGETTAGASRCAPAQHLSQPRWRRPAERICCECPAGAEKTHPILAWA